MNLKHYIIKKLGGDFKIKVPTIECSCHKDILDTPRNRIEVEREHCKPETVFYQTGYSKLPKGTGLTSDNLNKIFKKAIKKLKPTDQLPMINGKQLTQEDLNNWYKRKDEKDKED